MPKLTRIGASVDADGNHLRYTGQLMGGPGHGDLVEAEPDHTGRFQIERVIKMWLCDSSSESTESYQKIGYYRWNEQIGCWIWDGWQPRA